MFWKEVMKWIVIAVLAGSPSLWREPPNQRPEFSLQQWNGTKDLMDLEVAVEYTALADVAPERINEVTLSGEQFENRGRIYQKNRGYEIVRASMQGNSAAYFVVDEDGNYLVAGEQEQADGTRDIVLAKYDQEGNEIGTKTLGGSDFDLLSFLDYQTGLGIVIAGRSQSQDGDFGNESASAFVACIDAGTLAVKWVYFNQDADGAVAAETDSVYVIHNAEGYYCGGVELHLSALRLDAAGGQQWQTEPSDQWIISIKPLGGRQVALMCQSADGSSEIVILNQAGQLVKRQAVESSGDMTATADGGLIVSSIRNIKSVPQPVHISSIWFDTETVITKYNTELEIEWRKTYDMIKNEVGVDIVVPLIDGSVVVR